MSQDFQLAWLCPHLQTEASIVLGAGRTNLITRSPINGVGALVVRANGMDVPPSGLSSKAFLESGLREPYLVNRGSSTVTITTQGATKTFQLAPGYHQTRTLADIINLEFRSNVLAANSNGYLTLTEQVEQGPFSRVRVTGTAAAALGFGNQWGSTGKMVVPPWGLASLDDGVGFFIKFTQPVRAGYKMGATYPVAPNLCLRCQATGLENDIRTGDRSSAIMVTDNNLLYQMCLKIILTDLRSNVYYPWYGSGIRKSVGTKAQSGSALAIQQSIRTALTNLQGLQSSQAKFQTVSPRERLFAIDKVVVTESDVDPTVYLVEVAVRSYSSDPVSITIVYAAPGTYALPGTNGLSLGTP